MLKNLPPTYTHELHWWFERGADLSPMDEIKRLNELYDAIRYRLAQLKQKPLITLAPATS